MPSAKMTSYESLVRFLVTDDEVRAAAAAAAFEAAAHRRVGIFVNQIVVCELVWVLSVLALLVAGPSLSGQPEDQRPLPQSRDSRGLLRVDQTFFELSASTGGDFYFWAAGEFAMANLDVPPDGEEVLLSYGRMSGTRSFEVPVESGARELIVFIGVQRKDLAVIVRPDGTTLKTSPPDVRLQSFQHMLIATVASPKPGIWTVELTGEGIYEVSARLRPGDPAPSLDSFRFVEQRGRPGHEGLFEIDRPLRRGEALQCILDVSGTSADVTLAFADGEGQAIAKPAMTFRDGTFVGACKVPDRPFRPVVSGTDAAGAAFRRTGSSLTSPE